LAEALTSFLLSVVAQASFPPASVVEVEALPFLVRGLAAKKSLAPWVQALLALP